MRGVKRRLSFNDEASVIHVGSCAWSSDQDNDDVANDGDFDSDFSDYDESRRPSELQEAVERVNAIQKRTEYMIDDELFIATITTACIRQVAEGLYLRYANVHEDVYKVDRSRIFHAFDMAVSDLVCESRAPWFARNGVSRVKTSLRSRGITVSDESEDGSPKAPQPWYFQDDTTGRQVWCSEMMLVACDAIVRFVSNELWRTFESETNTIYLVRSHLIQDTVKCALHHYSFMVDTPNRARDIIARVQAILRVRRIPLLDEETRDHSDDTCAASSSTSY
ncbi:hypothetical protein DJ031_00160 [bacterium endosymbiont of Escarpia laminata]|nr:MAG: hypothetical protein DJ031_00160 [bacterium endosymbiont of Escarpia laminata]